MGNTFCPKPKLDEDEAPELGEVAEDKKAAAATGGGASVKEADEPKKEKSAPAPAVSASGAVTLGPYEGMGIISHIIGPHGKTLKQIQEDSGCEVNVNDDNTVSVSGDNTAAAVEMIEKIVEDAKHPDYVGAEGKRLRDEAQAMYQEADATYEKSQAAFDSGDKGQGHELLNKTKELRKNAKAKDKEAARAIWEHRNHESELKMDFHGLHVQEAMDLFEEHLTELQGKDKSGRVLEVIPGAGHHSKGGEGNAKLKPATIKILKQKGLQFTEHNAGSMYVNLDELSNDDFEAKCKELNDAE